MLRGSAVLATACTLLVLTVAPSTDAETQDQEGCVAPILTLPPGPWVFDPKESVGIFVNLENPNSAPEENLQVSLDVTHPEGWSAVLAQREFSLGAHNTSVTGLQITAPPRGGGASGGNITVSASAACVAGNVISPRVTTARGVEVRLAAPVVPWFAIGLGALGAVVLTSLFFVLEVRRGGIRLACDEPEKLVKPGKGVSFPLVLTNRGRHPERVLLTAPGLPEGWKAHLALGEVALEPRQTQELWVMVRAPKQASFGEEKAFTIRAEPASRPKDAVSVPVKVRVSPLRA